MASSWRRKPSRFLTRCVPSSGTSRRSGCATQKRGSCSRDRPLGAGNPEVSMRKIATALAVAFASLTSYSAFACEDRVETAQQPQQKPAVAEKARKQVKQQRKAKKADRLDKTAVARADR